MIDLDEQKMIDEVLSYHPKEIEPLYWLVEDSLYSNNMKLAKSVYKHLACLAKHKKSIIQENLKPVYMERLKLLAYQLFGDVVYEPKKPISVRMSSNCRAIPFPKESDLRDFLAKNKNILSCAYNDKIDFIEVEVLTDFDYRCDILAESENKCYPTELKIGQATHAVVSQIDKYCQYFYRKYRYAMHKNIQGVVIANGFDSYSINTLLKNGIMCFEVMPDKNDIISLRKYI